MDSKNIRISKHIKSLYASIIIENLYQIVNIFIELADRPHSKTH